MNKKGVFFSTDALIALIIILLSVMIIYPVIKYSNENSYVQGDIINVLSSLKIGEIDNGYVQLLISEGRINNLNNSILEQIGEFYVVNKTLAKELGEAVLVDLDSEENIGIWYGNTLIASKNYSSFEIAENIDVERQILSGINGMNDNESVKGYSARAFLSSEMKTKYVYLGGYVGEGNISILVDYSGELSLVEMELAITKDFEVYVNGFYQGTYSGSYSVFVPKNYSISIEDFTPGDNIIELRGEDLNVAGGYVKIIYQDTSTLQSTEKKYLPGIDGIINLYDGLDVPGELNDMEISLHFNNSFETFLMIGDTRVFENSSNDDTFILSNSYLSSVLDYNEISNKTIPIRFGMENVSYVSEGQAEADVFSVTDLSGSMNPSCSGASWWCCLFNSNCRTASSCINCGGVLIDDKIGAAKSANNVFINNVLNSSQNRVGLVGYRTSALDSDFHQLSNDNVSLINEVNSWAASGNTCICCGINKAITNLNSYSSDEKFQSVVLMSDGEANVQCAEQGTGNAKQDAIEAACDAYSNYGIRVYSIGFGNDADESTLQQIAICGNGSYYYSTIEGLVEVYQMIAQEIIDASYSEQTISVFNEYHSILYPDSYIEIGYDKEDIPYGLVSTIEKEFSDSYGGNFTIPENSTIIDAKVVSYSGPRWTQKVKINNNVIYDIDSFGSDYVTLGDPYRIEIPIQYIEDEDFVEVTTGLSSTNSSEGSQKNKIIYRILRNMISYAPISSIAEGCLWNVNFDDGTNSSLKVPSDYSGDNICSYSGESYDSNDAIQNSVYLLFRKLDLEGDGDLDIKFTEQNLNVDSSEIEGIPYTWSTEVQVRKWY